MELLGSSLYKQYKQWYSKLDGDVYHTSRLCSKGSEVIKNGNAINGTGGLQKCDFCKRLGNK